MTMLRLTDRQRAALGETVRDLANLAAGADIDPHLGHALEFINPVDGGSVMPTSSAHVRLVF